MNITNASHCMVDIETLGVGERPVILSCGAVKFKLEEIQSYEDLKKDTRHIYFNFEESLARGYSMDASTLRWWFGQSQEARKLFTKEGTNLSSGLVHLNNYLVDTDYVWSHGSFDATHLNSMSKHEWDSELIHRHKQMDLRTVLSLTANKDTDWPDIPKDLVAHDALADALYQVMVLQRVYQRDLKEVI